MSFLRVYRSDGTFGTIACPLHTTAERILQIAARKFFIEDTKEYHLVAVFPNRVRVFPIDSEPVALIHKVLVLAGHDDSLEHLNSVCRDDTSFLCRVVMSYINDPLRPPLLKQGHRELIATNTDVSDAPSLICASPHRVESMDLSRSNFLGTTLSMPRLATLKLNSMSLPDSRLIVRMTTLPSNLLTQLTTLELSGNGFDELEDLDLTMAPNLQHLDVRGNNLHELPKNLLHLPYLKVLLCGSNALTGFNCWNPSLYHVDLSYNKIQHLNLSPQEAVQMVNLKILHLPANCLSEYPEALRLLPELYSLDVRHNKITDTFAGLPLNLGNLIASYNKPLKLKHSEGPSYLGENILANADYQGARQLSHVKVEGIGILSLPENLSLNRITHLSLKNNSLSFLPESFFDGTPDLRVLDLSQNFISQLPSSMQNLHRLEDLSIANNLLMELPMNLFELPSLRNLNLHRNEIKTIPDRAFTCPKLKLLNLASNLLTSLPVLAQSSSSLVSLTLADNQLTDECFETILHLTGLQNLNLSYNFLTELPPSIFATLPALEELILSGNRLVTLPHDEFAQATQLRILAVNSNRLHMIPAELSKATRLEVLDASVNQLRYNVANWTFDWNWRWNKNLKYLNFSSNERMEIRKSHQFIPSENKVVDLGDFCVLPKIEVLGLMDVTVTTDAIPFQSENCRVRTFGSELGNSYKVGIAEKSGFRPLAYNDLVLERFRNRADESLIALFDGHCELASRGNKISHIAQETFGNVLKRELRAEGITPVDALRKAFLTMHREIGNIAQMSTAEVSHTTLGHISTTASRLTPADRASGTGATVVYVKGERIYIATVGGASVVLSRANGTYSVLSKPLPPVAAELDRIRNMGGIVDPETSSVNNISPYPRMIGCYTSGGVFSATPTIYEYDKTTIDPNDQIIIGTRTLWQYMRYETAADISRKCSHDSVVAALKIRDFAMAYGLRDRAMAIVLGRPQENPASEGIRNSSGDVLDSDSLKKRFQPVPEDSTLARLGSEVSPPFGDVTMVFTDIKSSTYLWENFPAVMQSAIKTHNSLMRRSIRLMDGYEVKNEGDAFIISFHTPIKALIWCLTVQQHLLTAEWPQELLEVDECKSRQDENGTTIFRGLSVRMGIHCGRPVTEPDPVTRRMDYFGPMVNRASRISGVAFGGQISVSTDFLNTLNHTMESHRHVHEGASLEDAYKNMTSSAAVALDKSAAILDHTAYVVKELGELKLRGIENPEHIYNIYPATLASREKWYEEQRILEQQKIAQESAVIQEQLMASQYQLQQQQLSDLRKASQISQMSQSSAQSSTQPSSEPDLFATSGIVPAMPSFVDFPDAEDSLRRKSSIYSDDFNSFDGYMSPDVPDSRRQSESAVSVRSFKSPPSGMLTPQQQPAVAANPVQVPVVNYPASVSEQTVAAPNANIPVARTRSGSLVPVQAPYSPLTTTTAMSTTSVPVSTVPAVPAVPVVPVTAVPVTAAVNPQETSAVEADPLQAISARLEVMSATISSPGSTLASNQQVQRALEPVIPQGSELATAGQLLWLTRLENAIYRLEHSSDWP